MAKMQREPRSGFRAFTIAALVGLFATLLGPLMASSVFGAELITSELQNSIVGDNVLTVEQGQSVNFVIGLSAQGNIDCAVTAAQPAKARVDKQYNIGADGTVTTGTDSAYKDFYARDSNCNQSPITWTAAPDPYQVTATVTTTANTPVGTYVILLCDNCKLVNSPAVDNGASFDTTDVNNPNQTGGKLGDATATSLTVNVTARPAPSDTTPPVISPTLNPAAPDGNNGWYTTKPGVELSWVVTDDESSIDAKSGCGDSLFDTDGDPLSRTCEATSAGGTDSRTVTIKRDATKPVVTSNVSGTHGDNGWYTSDVTIQWDATDATSGVDSLQNCGGADNKTSITADQAATEYTCTATDKAGNSDSKTETIKRDATRPDVAFDLSANTVANGGEYYFSFVPAKPGCTASDATSGLNLYANDAKCQITGDANYDAVGSHTLTAEARDNAGNTKSTDVSYRVLAWDVRGFYRPVDGGGILNTIKAGSTVPLKFEVFAGATELTDTNVVDQFTAKAVNCNGLADEGTDAIPLDEMTTGGTSLRYDETSGQFIQNWKTKADDKGKCFKVTLTTDDGSTATANFKLTK